MIYLDSSALVKLVKFEAGSDALRAWREGHAVGQELLTSELARLEITRTLVRLGVGPDRVSAVVDQALRGVFQGNVTKAVLERARSFDTRRLGSLDAIHLATAEPFVGELTGFVTYDDELAAAAAEVGITAVAPT